MSERHAVVIGASMGGLLAARALSDSYDRVTLVDRDALPQIGDQRKGVPQGRHAHGLLARGRTALEELFPGMTEELLAQGASTGDIQARGRWANEGRTLCQAPSGGALPPVIAAVLAPVATEAQRPIVRSHAVPQRPFTSAHARAPPLRA